LKDYPSIVSAVRNSDIVVNLIAQDRETRNFKASEVHVKGLKDIAKACEESKVSRFIHVSCGLVSQDSKSVIMKSRAEGERLLKEEFPKSIIVRGSTLFGHEDRFLRAIGGKAINSEFTLSA
jgi:NADH dehydrogenase (ubiquinone) 1 alpha subcomplex subunit 9